MTIWTALVELENRLLFLVQTYVDNNCLHATQICCKYTESKYNIFLNPGLIKVVFVIHRSKLQQHNAVSVPNFDRYQIIDRKVMCMVWAPPVKHSCKRIPQCVRYFLFNSSPSFLHIFHQCCSTDRRKVKQISVHIHFQE